MIPYSKQTISNSEIKSVVKVLKSNFLTQGPIVEKFENNLKTYTGAKYAYTTNSATSGLHIACLALNLQKGDIVWTTAISFVASANCALYCGGKVDFVDINNDNFNIDIDLLERKLKKAKIRRALPKILIIVHLGGMPCNLKKINSLSKIYKFKIIEDASHALGSKYINSKIGSCKYSSITIFSFHPVKPITTGEGGAVLTNSYFLAKKINMLRTHGITKNYKNFKYKIKSQWYYEQQLLGFNYRMNDMQAAIGIEQLKKISFFTNLRNKSALFYKINIDKKIFSYQKNDDRAISSYHLFIIKIKKKLSQKKYNKIFSLIRKNKIGINLHYFPIYKHPYYKNLEKKFFCRNAEKYAKSCFSIPLYPYIKSNVQKKILKKITNIVKKNS